MAGQQGGEKLVTLASQMFPVEFLIEKLIELGTKAKNNPKDKIIQEELEYNCAMYLAKKEVERSGLEHTLNKLERMSKGEALLTPNPN